jgi:hypothetical protein
MSLNPRGNPAGKIEIVIPVSPIESEGEKRLMKVELADLLASIPATNGALSAGVALLLKAVFTFGGRDDLDASANETIEDAVDMVLAGIAMYEPGEAEPPETAKAIRDQKPQLPTYGGTIEWRAFGKYRYPAGVYCEETEKFEEFQVEVDDLPPQTVAWGVRTVVTRRPVINQQQSDCLFRGMPAWASQNAADLAKRLNVHVNGGVE